MTFVEKLEGWNGLLWKFFAIYFVTLVVVVLFVVSFDFRWVISIFDANFIISAGIDHGGNAIHYTGLMDGLRSAAVAVGHAFS